MNAIELHIHDEGDVVIPAVLMDADLPAAELVALVAILAFQGGNYDFASKLLGTDTEGTAARSLRDRGIITITQTGNKVLMHVDLGKLPAPSPEPENSQN